MPANEFEKQVQRQLDDFQLNPSASVWKKVEEQISKKKRRRVVIFFIFSAALIMLGYFAYNLLKPNQKPAIVQQPVESNKKSAANDNNQTTNDKRNVTTGTSEQIVTDQTKETSTPGPLSKEDIKPVSKEDIKQKKKTIRIVNNDLDISVNNPATARKSPAVKKINETTAQKKPATSPVIKDNDAGTKQKITVTNNPPVKEPVTKNETTANVITEKGAEKDVTIIKDVAPIKADSVKINDIVAEEKKKDVVAKKKAGKFQIKWGIDFSAGVTSNQSRVFSLLKSSSADALYSNNNSGALANSPGTSTAAIIVPPSSIKPGAAFRIGIAAELKISERSRFSTGLQYSYASNRIRIGLVTDTTLRSQLTNAYTSIRVEHVYRGPQKYNYTNSYHFLSIPVTYHWQINKRKKLPIQWNAGISFNYLVATNALVYSPSFGGIYYYDKNEINKMHFNLGTGLSFRLKDRKNREWVLGPEIYFDTKKLVNSSRNANQYLLFGGINAKLFFNKKKGK